jgi:hypothetical protein
MYLIIFLTIEINNDNNKNDIITPDNIHTLTDFTSLLIHQKNKNIRKVEKKNNDNICYPGLTIVARHHCDNVVMLFMSF